MKTLSIIMAILVAFVTDYYAPTAAEKAICTAPVVPVCFNQAEPGSSYCSQHQNPIVKPCAFSFIGPHGEVVHCMFNAMAGSDYCMGHRWTPPSFQ